MRPLFHFPFPAQPPSQQPSHCSQKYAIARILHPCAAGAAPQRCFPLPARSPVPRLPDPGPLSPAPRAPAMPRPHPRLAPLPAPIAPHHLSTAPLPPAPIGLASSTSRPSRAVAHISSTPLRATIRIPLCRHRADSALIAPPITTIVRRRLTRVALRRPHRAHRVPTSAPPPHLSLLALRRPRGPSWQEPRRMHPLLAECAKKAPFLAISARNACFSRSRWQHPRPMHPFPGAIGRFRIHGARILPPRAHFRVEEPEITHGAKMLPAPRGLSAAAACGPAEWALRHAAAACDTRHGRTGFAPCGAGLACLPHARPLPSRLCPPPPAFIAAVLYASRFAARIAPTHAAIRRDAHCGRDELSIGLFLPPSCCPHRYIALPARRTHPASRADPPRPGNKRNNTSNSMRA